MEIFSKGIRFEKKRVKSAQKMPDTSRGDVVRFSAASRLRLRETVLENEIKGHVMYGVTLTIPRQADIAECVRKFSSAVHRLRVYFVRRAPTSGYVWRVELQRSRMPHLHLIAWCPPSFDAASLFLKLWYDICSRLFDLPSLSAFLLHGVNIKPLDDSISAYRYICDHAGKRKQAQLGYVGRQWGVVGRDNFTRRESIVFELPPCLESAFKRSVRRLGCFFYVHDCVFGSKRIRKRKVNSVSYISRDTVLHWLDVKISNLSFCKQLAGLLSDELPF